MKDLILNKPDKGDTEELKQLFTHTITDAFEKEKIDDAQGIKNEINEKITSFSEDLESNGKKRYFLVARLNNKIVGTISYGPCNALALKNSGEKLKDVLEIGTVYILPEYQKKGIGSILVKSMLNELKIRNITDFCLDSGYKRAQVIWRKKFGEPSFVIKDYWGPDSDHMIWYRKLSDVTEIKSLDD